MKKALIIKIQRRNKDSSQMTLYLELNSRFFITTILIGVIITLILLN